MVCPFLCRNTFAKFVRSYGYRLPPAGDIVFWIETRENNDHPSSLCWSCALNMRTIGNGWIRSRYPKEGCDGFIVPMRLVMRAARSGNRCRFMHVSCPKDSKRRRPSPGRIPSGEQTLTCCIGLGSFSIQSKDCASDAWLRRRWMNVFVRRGDGLQGRTLLEEGASCSHRSVPWR